MIRKILFATDFSPLSSEALRYTAELARKTSAGILGLHALKLPAAIYSFTPIANGYIRAVEESSRAQLRSFFSLPELAGVEVQTRLCEGLPEQAVSDLAAEQRADMIVVAKHSRSVLERFFVGSNTEKILREARCAVLVVPTAGCRSVAWNPVVCAVDFSLVSMKALHLAIQLARDYQGGLLVLHVVDSEPSGGIVEHESRVQLMHKWLDSAKERLERLVGETAAPPDTVRVVAEGKPSATILEKAQAAGSDLLILGSRGHTLQERGGIGSTTNAVLRSAHLPVLVVPG